jgi:hypothetical protein
MENLLLRPQEIPFDAPASCCMFQPSTEKPFVATAAAVALYGEPAIIQCLRRLRQLAVKHHGLDYLQVFTCPEQREPLWFIEDGDGGAITALLPSDY